MVKYHPISSKDLSKLHQVGEEVLPGIFFGYAMVARRIWKGDIMVADIDARRHFIFPFAEGTATLCGRDYETRE